MVSTNSFAQPLGYRDSVSFIVNKKEVSEWHNYGIKVSIDQDSLTLKYSNPDFRINDKSTTVSVFPQKIEKNILDSIKKELDFERYRNTPDAMGALTPSVPMMMAYYASSQLMDKIHSNAELPCIYVAGGLSEYCAFLIIKDIDDYFCLDRNNAKCFFAPISSKEEAISYLCLMEGVFPLYDFSFLALPYDEGFTYQVYKKEINPTYVIEEKDGYVVNMFDDRMHYYCIEIIYKVYTNGEIKIVDANKIYSIPIDSIID